MTEFSIVQCCCRKSAARYGDQDDFPDDRCATVVIFELHSYLVRVEQSSAKLTESPVQALTWPVTSSLCCSRSQVRRSPPSNQAGTSQPCGGNAQMLVKSLMCVLCQNSSVGLLVLGCTDWGSNLPHPFSWEVSLADFLVSPFALMPVLHS